MKLRYAHSAIRQKSLDCCGAFLQIALEKKNGWKISPVAGHSQRPEQKLQKQRRNEVPKVLA